MAAFNPRQTVDLNSNGPGMITQAYGHVGDAKAHQWDVVVVRGGAPVDLTGYTAMALVNNGAGTVEIVGTIAGNVATAIFPAACYTEGVHECFMRISKASDSSEVITAKMHLNITEGETGTVIDPGTDITATLSGLLASEAERKTDENARKTDENARKAAEAARAAFYSGFSSQLAAKANKVTGATAGRIASLTGAGDIADSAYEPKHFALAREFSGAYDGVDLSVVFASEIAGYSDVWAWIKARVQAENLEGLHVHDYIAVTCTNTSAYVLKMEIVGINTYKGSGTTEIPAHIDWLSKDCWPDAVQYNPVNYNNGIGLDKFTGNGSLKVFQLTRREVGYPALASVTVGAATMTLGTDYTYDVGTGILTFTAAPANAAVIKATWTSPVVVPFIASNVYAYMNSLRMGIPNEAAADPLLTEVDYTNGGIYKFLPAALKAVISPKHQLAARRLTVGSLLTNPTDYVGIDIGPLWIPDEMEIYGTPMYATSTYDKWYSRWYPAFMGGNRKKGTGNGGSRAYWWLFPAYSGSNTSCCIVNGAGLASYSNASSAFRVPVGFRIRKS